MRSLGIAARLVFARRGYAILAVCTVALTAALYTYSGQIVTIYSDGSIFVDSDPAHLAALALLSLLMGLVVPMQVFAVRRAAGTLWVRVGHGGTGLLGFVAGLASVTCCSPLLIPSLLSFAGFSGSSLLTLNYTLYRYFEPLALLSIALLLLSLLLAARDITHACARTPRGR